MTGRRSGLGRGLEALIPRSERSAFAMVPTTAITPNPRQPRTVFDETTLAELAASIREVGILQPLVLRRQDEVSYALVAGERRWRAAQIAGLEEVPAIIREGDDTSSLTEALVENIQREDLSALEEAAAYQQLQEDFGLTHAEIGQRVGKSRAAVSNALRLLSLPPRIQTLLGEGKLSAGHSRALLGLEDFSYAVHVAERAAEEGWSVRQVEDAVRARTEAGQPLTKPRVQEVRPAAIIELEQRLGEHLGAPVKITYRNNRGNVTMSFTSLEELEQIYRRFFV